MGVDKLALYRGGVEWAKHILSNIYCVVQKLVSKHSKKSLKIIGIPYSMSGKFYNSSFVLYKLLC